VTFSRSGSALDQFVDIIITECPYALADPGIGLASQWLAVFVRLTAVVLIFQVPAVAEAPIELAAAGVVVAAVGTAARLDRPEAWLPAAVVLVQPRRAGPHRGASKATDMASKELDRLGDASVTEEERQSRKRRILKGPKEFREMRDDLPRRKGRARSIPVSKLNASK
jgi:NAD(P)H-dependent flavin oxidoreductase YrpB (nitropropane dioxygenase family)